jgi:hypothetical protein
VRIAGDRATVRLGPPPYPPDLTLRCFHLARAAAQPAR